MANGHADIVWQHLCDLVAERRAAEACDAELLERFVADRDEAAFAALVRRHGPLVWGVCRRVLHDWHAAEDAFQATFLILARKAATVTKRTAVAAWLYRVAYHAATRARARAGRHQRRERLATASAAPDPLTEVTGRELLAAVDEEVQGLPERYRAPLVLCYLEGHTRDEAAQALGWSLGTLKRRLEQAKARLRARLTRRGLALSAGLLATALAQQGARAVPAGLVQAAVQTAGTAGRHGLTASGPAALAEATLQAMGAVRPKTTAVVVLSLGLLALAASAMSRQAAVAPTQGAAIAHGRTATLANETRPSPQPRHAEAPPADAAPNPSDDPNRPMTITGRVIDDKGRPVAGADVAATGYAQPRIRAENELGNRVVLAEGKTDTNGHYRLVVRGVSAFRFWSLSLYARRAGHALGRLANERRASDLDADRFDADLPLPPERPTEGRLVDLQGQPAPHVKLRVLEVYEKGWARYSWYSVAADPRQDMRCWPPAVTTDAQGRFTLRGIGPRWTVLLGVQPDDRFAPQRLILNPNNGEPTGVANLSVAPARILAGTVSYADTGKPAAGTRVDLDGVGDVHNLVVRVDVQGRFRVSLPAVARLQLRALPPDRQPYLATYKELTWPKGRVALQGVQVALPRGLLLRGRVTEKASGKPVAGAAVQYGPFEAKNRLARELHFGWTGPFVVSGPDGHFQLPVLPGPGHLFVNGPTPDYVHEQSDLAHLYRPDTLSNYRYYADAIIPLDLKPDRTPAGVNVALRRGVTVRGRLVGPQGQEVDHAVMLCTSFWTSYLQLQPTRVPLRLGRFELHGRDPDKAEPVVFVDSDHQWGAVAQISGKQAGKPLTVRLQPCGSARVRFVDAQGQPLPGLTLSGRVQIAVAPGITVLEMGRSSALIGLYEQLNGLARDFRAIEKIRTDAQGRATVPLLVPGATFRVVVEAPPFCRAARVFTAESGKSMDLGDIVIEGKPLE
jgi:RNA polymerase sigma factor (sigma-70 family)